VLFSLRDTMAPAESRFNTESCAESLASLPSRNSPCEAFQHEQSMKNGQKAISERKWSWVAPFVFLL
jgi:hypothetical protein